MLLAGLRTAALCQRRFSRRFNRYQATVNAARQTLRFLRVPYDTAAAARKVREAGLPEKLALRLEQGR